LKRSQSRNREGFDMTDEGPQRPITGINLADRKPYVGYAWGDGEHDDQPAIQEAWDCCGLIRVPSGIYSLDNPLVGPKVIGAGIVGAGGGCIDPAHQLKTAGTIFVATFEQGTVITSGAHVTHATFKGFAIDRLVEPKAGYGLDMNISNDGCDLSDLWIEHQLIGLNLATTGYSKAEMIRCQLNKSNGFNITGQWQLDRCFSACNDGIGFACTHALETGNSLGQYKGLSTYNNASHGIAFTGKVYAVRLSDSFFGGDGGAEVYLGNDQPLGQNIFTNVYTEGCRSDFAWVIAAQSGACSLINCSSAGNVRHGLFSESPFLSIHGGVWAGHAGYGILVNAGRALISGANCPRNGTAIGATAAARAVKVMGCALSESGIPHDLQAASGVELWGNL
jgi:hypothetical protein